MKRIATLIIILVVFVGGWYFLRPLFIDDQVNEVLPDEFQEISKMSAEEKKEAEMKMLEVFADFKTEVNEGMEMIGPEIVLSGEFMDADNFHKGSGQAKVLKSKDSSLLRFENFEVTNGPALRVYLSSNQKPTDHESLGEYIDLGELKGNIGNQNYLLDGVDISKYKSVVIYCKPFSVVFSVATLM